MKKIVYLDKNAKNNLDNLPKKIQAEFYAQFKVLEKEGKLNYPYAKKISQELFEIRIKVKNIYRAFYAYIKINQIIILHIFNKKTKKTPLKEMKLAKKRLKKYE